MATIVHTAKVEKDGWTLLLGIALALTCYVCCAEGMAETSSENSYPAAGRAPDAQQGWETFLTRPDPDAPEDEAMGGRTAAGTPLNPRNELCFPAETRNVFSEVDMVVNEASGQLEPFDYTSNGSVDEKGREAVRGQNTWMLWGAGNETFWNWLQEDGYGLVDFMVLLDSRKRDTRFERTGMINQPGFRTQQDSAKKLLGLYLDEVDGDKALMKQPATDIDARTGELAKQPMRPQTHGDAKKTELFEPGDPQLYRDVLARLPTDGVDPTVYGYPSGVVGLRMLPNPDFFGNTPAAQQARADWDERVVRSDQADAFYNDVKVHADPNLIRPFRVSMACAFCHVGPHPLHPPANPEAPEWENLSSIIGNQYWSPPHIFANLTKSGNLIYQFLASQRPGTVDTSLVSTDHINNPNTINAVFDVPSRLERADLNLAEAQGPANLLLRSLEEVGDSVTPRHTPRVLVDGADSIGVFGALSRVYLNIGTHSDEWARCHNPIIGFKPQRPFSIATLQDKSVYWRSGDKYRIPALATFFTYKSTKTGKSIAAPIQLKHAPGGREILDAERAAAKRGRAIFVDNCALCHSSKQPEGFNLQSSAEWAQQRPIGPNQPMQLTLPNTFADWVDFKMSPPYREYLRRIRSIAKTPVDGEEDEFLKDNFLSADVRIPVTLVGTNSARAVGTNAMRGQVWDNFSSEDYKSLSPVGAVHFYNPYSAKGVDKWGNNDAYYPPGGGPGYYRPASLISLWATAPYLHNNTLGLYNADPSVAGRLEAFEDGIDRLLWMEKRVERTDVPGDLRFISNLARKDPGFIYRTTESTKIEFPAKFIGPLLEGLLGRSGTSLLTTWLWIGLSAVALLLALVGRSRHVGFVMLLFAVLAAILIIVGRFDRVTMLLWLAPGVALAAALYFWLRDPPRALTRIFFVVLAGGSIALTFALRDFVAGNRGDLSIGPIPHGTPINLVMNMNPEAPLGNLVRASTALLRGILISQTYDQDADKLQAFEAEAGQSLLEASKCPDFVLDRGHWFAEGQTDEEKRQLKAFLKTL